MRIKRLEIYGYGKWVDTTFNLEEDIHMFYGENEAGKSTLMSFIHSILFGFPTRNSTLLRYEPRESSRYGGKIIAEDNRFGEVIIERIHGKVTGNVEVTLEDGTIGHEELLDSVLYGIDRTMFQNIFSFSLTDIENVHKLNKDQLSRYLLTIGTHGTEHFLELADQFHADADKLYRPSGRVLELNQQLEKIKKQEEQLIALEKNNGNYLNLLNQNLNEKEALNKVEDKEIQKKEELNTLREFKKQHHVLQEIKTLAEEVAKIQLPPLKEDGRYLLDEYKRELTNLQTQLEEIKNKQKEELATLEEGELLGKYQEHLEAIDSLENDLPDLIEAYSAYENMKANRVEVENQLYQLKLELDMNQSAKGLRPFTTIEAQNVRSLSIKNKNILSEDEKLSAEISAMQNELNLKNQKLDQYEDMMWDATEFKEVETELIAAQKEEDHSATRNRTPLVLGILGAIVLGLGAILLASPFNWILGLLAVISLIIGSVLSKEKPKLQMNDYSYLQKEYDRQKLLKDEWQDALSDLDALQENYQRVLKKQEGLVNQQKVYETEWREVLKTHLLPLHYPLAEAEQIIEKANAYSEVFKTINESTEKQAELEKSLEEKTAPVVDILSLEESASYGKRITEFRTYHSRLRQEMTKEQDKIQQLNAWNHEEKQIKQKLEMNKEKTQLLLDTADTKTEEEFVALYQKKDALDKKKSRLKFLQENAPSFDPSKKLPTKEELDNKEKRIQHELQDILTNKREALRKQANTQLSIERLEKDGTYTDALQTFENQKATIQRLVDEWVSAKLAAGMIQEALNQVTEDRFKEILADAQTYFHLLTDGEYEKIVFKDEELFVREQTGQLVDVRVLSRGTAEPLYVAIRLAYIKNTQDIMELPIIMDDPFVNFDQKRRQNMYRLLTQLSSDLQLIYFTFDSEAFTYFTNNQITDLETRK